jgi:hypothetical protein
MNLFRLSLLLSFFALFSTAGGALSAEPPKPRNGEKLIVINDDGFSAFHSGRYRTAEDLRKRILRLQDTQVGVFEWCIVAGSRVNFPSDRHELIGEGLTEYPRRGDKFAAETLARMKSEGVDTLQVIADACHESGISCYASMRMNGDYSAKAWEGTMSPFFNSDFWKEHPEFHQRTAGGIDQTRLSFAYPEVREFKLSILREAVERDIDGINLDFLRHPTFFSFEEAMLTAFEKEYGEDGQKVAADDSRWELLRGRFMTEFVRETRRILDAAGEKKGKQLGLSVRIDWQKFRGWGCDIESWLKEGLLDYLVVSQYGLGGYEFDIAPFVEMARDSGCAVLFGEEGITDGHDVTAAEDKLIAEGKMKAPPRGRLSLQQHQSRAARWYAAGADGVHLFNVGNPEVFKTLGSVEPATSPSE